MQVFSKNIYPKHLFPRSTKPIDLGLWSSGYDVAFTRRRSPVQIRLSPLKSYSEDDIENFLNILELSGITSKHKKEVHRTLKNYSKYILFETNKVKSLSYFKHLKDTCSIAYYKKQMYQVRKFLNHLNVEWAKDIILPSDPVYYPKRISLDDIHETLSYFEEHKYFKQVKALILLGSTSGMRAEEIYQLEIEDIDIENRVVYIHHNPSNSQTTKTRRSRVSFFNEEAQRCLSGYIDYFENNRCLKKLFSQTHLERLFSSAPIRVKDLRKFFSQEWDRRGGPTSIKKILMGHSLKGDIDLMHYNCQSEEDLKKIYDRVMSWKSC